MQDTPLLEFGDWLMLIAAIGGIVFAISYSVFFRWTKTAAGRALLAFVVSLDLVFVLGLLSRFIGQDYWGREIFRIAVYGSVLISIWSLVFVLWRSWSRGDAKLDLETRHTGSNPQV